MIIRMSLKIDMVFPPSITDFRNYSSEPPLGPLSLLSELSDSQKKRTRFLDSSLLENDSIENMIRSNRADIVAFSCNSFNYPKAIHMASIAKEHDAVTIIGGIHATHRSAAILQRMQRNDIPFDYLITGCGESAFARLVKALSEGECIPEIPNLSYIEDDHIVSGPRLAQSFFKRDLSRPLDYSFVDFSQYAEHFDRIGNLASISRPGSTYSQRGCTYTGFRKCVFCSIEETTQFRSINNVCLDVINLVNNAGVDHIRINDGNFTSSKRHIHSIANAILDIVWNGVDMPSFYCFTRADEIDQATVSLLKKMNVIAVFIGYESGSNKMLQSMHKNITIEQNLAATRLLSDNGIDVAAAGIVLGAEGESLETLEMTVRFIEELYAIGNVKTLAINPLIPLPGSHAYTKLIETITQENPSQAIDLNNRDFHDFTLLIELWNHYMTSVTPDALSDSSSQIELIIEKSIAFI